MAENSFYEAIEQANAGLQAVKTSLKEVQAIAIETSQQVRDTISSSQGAGTPKDASANIKKTTTAVNEFGMVVTKTNSKISAMISLHKQRKAAEEAANRATTKGKQIVNEFGQVTIGTNKHIQAMVSLQKQKEKAVSDAAKADAREAAELKKKSSTYLRLNKHFQFLKATYRDLAIKKQLNIKLTANEEARMIALKDKILVLDKAYKQVDGSMGVYNRSVGQYGKAFDSLGFSVAQITREAPAFLNSVQTGFMAISNNIPIFVDELEKLKIKNQQLMKDNKKAIPIWHSLKKAIFSYQTAISLGILALTFFGPELFKILKVMFQVKEATDGVTEATKKMAETQRNAMKDADLEVVQIQNLAQAASNLNLTYEERLAAIEKLRELAPLLTQDISDQVLLQGQSKEAIAEVTKQMYAQAIAAKDVQRVADIYGELRENAELNKEAQEALTTAQREWEDGTKAGLDVMEDVVSVAIRWAQKKYELNKLTNETVDLQSKENALRVEQEMLLDKIVEEQKQYIASLDIIKSKLNESKFKEGTVGWIKLQIAELQKQRDEIQATDYVALAAIDNQIEAYKKLIEKQKESTEYSIGSLGWFDKQISKNNELMKQAKDRETVEKLEEENELIQRQIDFLRGLGDAWKEMSDKADLQGMVDLADDLNDIAQDMLQKFEPIKLEDIIEIDEGWDFSGEDYIDGFDYFFDTYKDRIGGLTKLVGVSTERMREEFAKVYTGDPQDQAEFQKQFKKFVQETEDDATALLKTIEQVIGVGSDLAAAITDRRIQKLEHEKDMIEERYETEMEMAEDNFVSQEELDNKKEALEEEKEIRQKEIDRKIAKEKNKQAKIDKAAALASVAINTAIAITRLPAEGGFLGLATVPIMIALGALQAATILAQPLPEYAEGVDSHPGGFAVLGDGGKHEAAILPTGQIWKSPKTDTVVDLPKGTRVEPDFDRYMQEQNKQIFDSTLLKQVAEKEIKREQDRQVLDAIKDQTRILKRKKLSVNVTNKIGHEIWKSKQINWS